MRAKRSKAEMQQEFAEIQEQVESAHEAADAKAEGAARLHATEIRQAAEGITVEAVVQRISGLGLEVGKALADVSERWFHNCLLGRGRNVPACGWLVCNYGWCGRRHC
jgi:colicin import membrane protein